MKQESEEKKSRQELKQELLEEFQGLSERGKLAILALALSLREFAPAGTLTARRTDY